jgi:ankyrin repeat protein
LLKPLTDDANIDLLQLHFASYFGRPNIVEELLSQGASVDDGTDVGAQTPLHMASLAGNVQMMRKLLRRGANPNAVANDIGPVLNGAIYSGNQEAVRLLVEQGVSLSFDHEEIDSPLQLAALLSDLTMFEYLIESYADKLSPHEYDKALISSAEAGRFEVFKKLLPYQHTAESFQKALEGAAEEENWDIVMTLLEDFPGLQYDEAFHQASTSMEQHDKVLEAIWKHTGGTISQETLDKSLYDASDREKLSTVELCLRFGANPNATGEEYGNALTAAAYDGTIEIVKKILDAGGDVNAPEGWALQTAAAEGHYEVVEELLARGAKINAVSEHQMQGTALQAAVEAGKSKIVSLLLEHDADPNLGSGPETCPIIAAARKGEAEIFELLINAKARVDVFGGPDMSTPLTNAAAYLPLSSMQLLLDAGADINLPDQVDDTALIVASRRGDSEYVKFLLENGADLMFTQRHGDRENALKAALTNNNDECMKLLVDRVSVILSALKMAVDEGNTAVASIIRSVAVGGQLNYGDATGGEGQLSYDDPVREDGHDKAEVVETSETLNHDPPMADTKPEAVVSHVEVKPDEPTNVSLEAALENPLSFFNTYSQPFQPFEPQPTETVELEAPHHFEQPARQQWVQEDHVPERPPSNPAFVRKAVRPLSRYNGKFSPNISPAPSETSASQYQPPATQQPTPPTANFAQPAASYPSPVMYQQEAYVPAQQTPQQPVPQQQHQAQSFSPPYEQQSSQRYQSPQPYNYNDSSFAAYQPGPQQPYQPPQSQQPQQLDQPYRHSQSYPPSQPAYQPQQPQQSQPPMYSPPAPAPPPAQYQYNPANTHQPYRPQPAQTYSGTYPEGYRAPQQPSYGRNQRNSQQVSYDGEGWGDS